MPENATRPINRWLSQNCVYVPAEIYMIPDSPPQQKDKIKKTL
jgi:hypothetical protein